MTRATVGTIAFNGSGIVHFGRVRSAFNRDPVFFPENLLTSMRYSGFARGPNWTPIWNCDQGVVKISSALRETARTLPRCTNTLDALHKHPRKASRGTQWREQHEPRSKLAT
jgi:hypothetical protein